MHATCSLGLGLYSFSKHRLVKSPDLYVAAAVLSILAAVVGAIRALWNITGLSPAVAMSPPDPPKLRHLWSTNTPHQGLFSQRTTMMLRNLVHHPICVLLTTVGMSLATAILVVSLLVSEMMENLIDVTYLRADRQDATVTFPERRQSGVNQSFAHLPGVLVAEPYREVPVRIRKANVERRIMISGRPRAAQLSQIIDIDLKPAPDR